MKKSDYELVYKTSTTPFFPSYFVGCGFSTDFHKVAKTKYKAQAEITLIINGEVSFFFNKAMRVGAEAVLKKYFSSPKLLSKIKKKEKIISANILNEIKSPINSLFTQGKLNQLGEKKLHKIFELIKDYASYIDVPGFLFQVYYTDNFQKEIIDFIAGDESQKAEAFNLLISSHDFTNYEHFLLDLHKNLHSKSAYKKIAKRYYWLIHDYLGNIIDEKYVAARALEMKKNKNYFEKSIQEAKERREKIRKIIKAIPPAKRKMVIILGEMMHLYNDRKKQVVNQANIYLRKVFEHKFTGLTISQLRKYFQLTPDEILNLLKEKESYDIKERSSRFGYKVLNWKISIAPEEYFSLMEDYEKIKLLKGISASAGKVSGRISIVLNISHIHLFKPGRILVAPFTNVNYMPIMSKAKAIITDTGGLTSHAAIVSRELKIPFIVNTKNATKALKDGDLVEVDANKGIVKKIK